MSVTAPKGFKSAGLATGLRKSGRPDMAIVVNEGPLSVAAGVYTTNRVEAAPVTWSRAITKNGQARAVVINSGNANACTGSQGMKDAASMAEMLAQAVGCETEQALVCSTGVIGRAMPMDLIAKGIVKVANELSEQGGENTALAILTTDTKAKTVIHEGDGWSIGAMAKGAGMLAPALATMIGVITTDAVIDAKVAQNALDAAVEKTFNRLDSDGCMSTNDTVLLMSSGACGINVSPEVFEEALTSVCAQLALKLLGDAEGANHDIHITVTGAPTQAGALAGARAVSRSNLVKTAVYGNDPNWGRILAQIGTVSEKTLPFNPNAIDVSINGVKVCENGGLGADPTLVDMKPRQCEILIELKSGPASADLWTSDLTHEYVHINGDYTT